jgi:hypothetical protein
MFVGRGAGVDSGRLDGLVGAHSPPETRAACPAAESLARHLH